MGAKDKLQKDLEELIEPVCEAHGVELVEVRQVQGRTQLIIRVMIDRQRPASDPRPGSAITLDDCTAVSRDLSTAFDVHEDMIAGQFNLEVSSPGLDRPLVKQGDFERFAGREIKLRTHERVVGNGRNFTGQLLGIEGEEVRLEVSGEVVAIPYEAIARANLVPKF